MHPATLPMIRPSAASRTDPEAIRLTLRMKLMELALSLPAGTTLAEPVNVAEALAGGMVLSLTFGPAPTPRPIGEARGPCQRDILALLLDIAPNRLTADRIHAELARRGQLWGLSTIKQNIPNLSRAGLVFNNYDQLGYGVTTEGKASFQRPGG